MTEDPADGGSSPDGGSLHTDVIDWLLVRRTASGEGGASITELSAEAAAERG